MKAFRYLRPASALAACNASSADAVLKAGGIDLLDRLKERVDEPDAVIELGRLTDERMREIAVIDGGALEVGALVTLAELAASPLVAKAAPSLAEAAGLAASPALRRRATIAGNLLQHTRCGYYRHRSFPCLKRGDDACPVLDDGAVQDTAAIFGNSVCASAHPASLPPILAALGARAVIRRAPSMGESTDRHDRVEDVAGLFVPPEKGRAGDTNLAANDVILRFEVPAVMGAVDGYAEVRQKAAFDWALASCAVRVVWNGEVFGKKVAEHVHIWLGSVAPTPHRAEAAEKALLHKELTEATIVAAAEAAVTGATPLAGNTYKVELAKVAVRRALAQAAGRK